MRTPVGSSKIVARSRSHSSPACEPNGVIFTFCAQPAEHPRARAHARKICFLFISPPVTGSIDRRSAVYDQSMPGDESGARTGKIADRRRDFLRRAEPPQGDPARHELAPRGI